MHMIFLKPLCNVALDFDNIHLYLYWETQNEHLTNICIHERR